MFYLVIEVQASTDGKASTLVTSHDNKDQALAKLYSVLSAAAVSALPYHGAWLLNSNGVVEEVKIFDRK